MTPAGIGIGTPKSGSAIGPIGPVKRIARIPIRTDDPAPNSTGRIGSTVRTETNTVDSFAVADDRGLIGHGAGHERTRRDKRKNDRNRVNDPAHECPALSFGDKNHDNLHRGDEMQAVDDGCVQLRMLLSKYVANEQLPTRSPRQTNFKRTIRACGESLHCGLGVVPREVRGVSPAQHRQLSSRSRLLINWGGGGGRVVGVCCLLSTLA